MSEPLQPRLSASHRKRAAAVVPDSELADIPAAIPLDVDTPLDELKLFSTRVQNALLRQGVVTLRLLLMHTPALLQKM